MDTHFFTLSLLYFAAHLHYVLSMNSVDKIIGGSSTNIESVPYVLAFYLINKYVCCATIINEQLAVTAAHCVASANSIEDISVRSGSSSFLEGGTIHKVTNVSIHKKYDDMTNDYDICIIKVTPPFTYGDSTRPVGLARSDAKHVPTDVGVVCGWGYYMKMNDYIDHALPEELQCVILPLIDKNQCKRDYKFRDYELTPRMTCYGFQDGMIDSCKGDSGAALVNKEDNLIGITSWGVGCGEPDSPGVYTSAIVVREWIEDEIKKFA